MDDLEWLQAWYVSNCDGEWEHGQGVKIATLDNPGWSVEVELRDTRFQNLKGDELNLDLGDDDWIRCWVAERTFQGRGDALKLKQIIAIFRAWMEAADRQT